MNDVEMHHMDVDPVEFFDDACMDLFNYLALNMEKENAHCSK